MTMKLAYWKTGNKVKTYQRLPYRNDYHVYQKHQLQKLIKAFMRSPKCFITIVVKSHIVRNEEGYAHNLGITTHPNLLSE